MVKADDENVILFLIRSDIIRLCLRIMETGSELSRTVATFIVQKILMDNHGLQYVCDSSDRFYAINNTLGIMVGSLQKNPSTRLLKHVTRCYMRLSENPRFV